ncbi:MAG: hypothetical protein L3J74_07650 [Bacteroidales bacterium]|nr:hypothetical protein [Bacteroidales bacterium]
MNKLFILLITIASFFYASAQEEDSTQNTETSFDIGMDISNRYIWRGLTFSNAPVIQPYMSYTAKGLTVGTWASYPFLEDQSQEVDIFLSYNYKIFTFTLNDYYFLLNPFGGYSDYFDWDKNTTTHYLEGIFEISEIKNLPLRFLAGVMLLGADVDVNNNRNFSTYFEFAYNFKIKELNAEVFAGFTPFEGFYSDGFDFTNIGFKASKVIPVTQKFSLPLSASFIINPAANKVLFLATISF